MRETLFDHPLITVCHMRRSIRSPVHCVASATCGGRSVARSVGTWNGRYPRKLWAVQ
jgi:hypothetical protein